jgi:uncharacterized damage-inducible protein DinB
MYWADQQLVTALRDCVPAQEEALPLLAHLLAAEHVWLSRIQQRETALAVWPHLSLSECEDLAAKNAVEYGDSCARLGEAELAAQIRYRNTKGQEFSTPLIDILTHVVIHGAYHRGQIARAIGRAGAQAVNTDYITYVREFEPI